MGGTILDELINHQRNVAKDEERDDLQLLYEMLQFRYQTVNSSLAPRTPELMQEILKTIGRELDDDTDAQTDLQLASWQIELGQIAELLGNDLAAKEWYQQAIEISQPPGLERVAFERLNF